MNDTWVWIRIKLKTLLAARSALKLLSMARHEEARNEPHPDRRATLRAEGDQLDAAAEDVSLAERRGLTRVEGE